MAATKTASPICTRRRRGSRRPLLCASLAFSDTRLMATAASPKRQVQPQQAESPPRRAARTAARRPSSSRSRPTRNVTPTLKKFRSREVAAEARCHRSTLRPPRTRSGGSPPRQLAVSRNPRPIHERSHGGPPGEARTGRAAPSRGPAHPKRPGRSAASRPPGSATRVPASSRPARPRTMIGRAAG